MRSRHSKFLLPLLLVAIGGCAKPKPEPTIDTMRVESYKVRGDRGAKGSAPENSILAFRKAIEQRAPALELDLQATKDRVLIVESDTKPNRRRCAFDDGRPLPNKYFKEIDFDSLATVDCGREKKWRFLRKTSNSKIRISRLEEVLSLAGMAMYPVRLNINIKWKNEKESIPVNEFAALLVKAIKQARFQKRVTVVSNEPIALLAVHRLAPTIPLAILTDHHNQFATKVKTNN